MSKRSFQAGNWLLKESKTSSENPTAGPHSEQDSQELPEKIKAALAPFVPKSERTEAGMRKFFIPGWKGESLISKEVKKFKDLLDAFHQDAVSSFLNRSNFNRRLKSSIYDEFMAYAEYKTCVCSEVDDYVSFWKEVHNKDSEYRDLLDQFIEIFCFRVAVIYILKIRFISVLTEQSNLDCDLKKLAYPNSFLTSVFQKGGKNELKSKALEQNIYSWFRPSDNCVQKLEELRSVTSQITVTEIIKNISLKSERLLGSAEYSHAISHKNFGLFVNSLLINFPLWLSIQSSKGFHGFKNKTQGMEILSCKFSGDYLESLSLSHWLAQNANKEERWDQILCPDFKNMDFEAGHYWKIFNELQFLTFLAQIANVKGKDPINFVSQVANAHLQNRKQNSLGQKSLLSNDISLNQSTYDRIVVNLSHYPKNNSQHFLLTKIQEQRAFLKQDGFLYVISSKRLFVPSQKDKVEALLKSMKVEGVLRLEDVQGKGEVGSFIYIFSQRKASKPSLNKQTCFTFRLSASLSSFQNFSQLTKLVQDFFIDNLGDPPPLYRKSFSQAKFEFFQDAIVKGRLIHSSSKDSSKITHPHFFDNLLSSCYTLDYFFNLQQINFHGGARHEDPLFEFSGADSDTTAPYIIIVDSRQKERTNLEVIPSRALEAKAYEYGHSMCFYFGAYPKWPSLNIDAISDFFSSPVGGQLIDLTFSGELRKVKANLNKLLLPKVFAQTKALPEHVSPGIRLLESSSDEILEMRPSRLKEDFATTERLLCEIAKNYPGEALNSLSVFKRSVRKGLDMFDGGEVNFNNPIIKTPLVLSKTYKIYPDNEEIYVEFEPEKTMRLIHSPLERVKKKRFSQNGIDNHSLELFTQESKVITIYSDEDMILFLKFIFSNLYGVPLSQLLQGVAAPRLEDLKNIISSFNSLCKTLEEIHARIPQVFSSLINQNISRS